MTTKSVCIIASPKAVFDGDVIFLNTAKFGSSIAVYCEQPNYGLCTNAGLQIYSLGLGEKAKIGDFKSFRIAMLWFWHMVILRKSHVYLTGVLK